MLKRCTSCGYSNESILTHLIDAAEEKCLCPNCVAVAVANGSLSFEATEALCDDVTGELGAVVFINGNERYLLTPNRMKRLLAHDLRPYEWQALANKYGANQFMLHDDFYTEDGASWQPTVRIPVYEWWDVVEINGKHYCEVFEISGEMDGDEVQPPCGGCPRLLGVPTPIGSPRLLCPQGTREHADREEGEACIEESLYGYVHVGGLTHQGNHREQRGTSEKGV